MIAKTRFFGQVDISDDKIIEFDRGLMGFEEYKRYTLLYDIDKDERPAISWLQSLDEPSLALPVINPLVVKPDYNPTVEDELLITLGELTDENLVILLTMTVPTDITKMSVNLKAPLIVNADSRKGVQLIVENEDYEVKYHVYDVLKKKKGAE